MLPGKRYDPELIARLLWQRRWFFVVPLWAAFVGGLLYSRNQPDQFRSTALIQVIPQRVPENYVAPTVTQRVEDRIRTLAQQVLSRTELEKTIQELDLYPRLRATEPMENVVEEMRRHAEIAPVATISGARPGATTDAFRVSFVYSNAALTQKVVDRMSRRIIDENAKSRGNLAEATSEFLDTQLADARTRLEQVEGKLRSFRERNAGRLPTQLQTNMQAISNHQMQLQALVESLARDKDRKLILERLYNDATQSPITVAPPPTPAAPANQQTAQGSPSDRLAAARALLTQLEQRLTPQHPDVTRTKSLIADLEKQVKAEAAKSGSGELAAATATGVSPDEARRVERIREMRAEIAGVDSQIQFKEAEERRIRGLIANYQSRLESTPSVESELIALTRDYDTQQASYRDLLTKSENSRVAANLEQRQIGEQFRMIDSARVPELPFSPKRWQISAASAMAGLGIGALLVGFLEYRNTTMESEGDVLGALELPVLAVVPYIATSADEARAARQRWLGAIATVCATVITGGLTWYLELWRFIV